MAYITREEIPESDPTRIPDLKNKIDQIIRENKNLPGSTMVVLNELQGQIGYISEPMQHYAARNLNIPVSKVHGVVSFYSFFSTKPRGRHTVKFCMGTACYVGGTPQLIERTKQELGIAPGETTEDNEITLEICRCVGACSKAPVLLIDDEQHGNLSPSKVPRLIRSIQRKNNNGGKE